MRELFEKVEIKSEADLPKEDGDYIVHSKITDCTFMYYWEDLDQPDVKRTWLRIYDWYLRPIEQPSDEDIRIYILHDQEELINTEVHTVDELLQRLLGRTEGAKAMRDRLITTKK